eukprot:TRINITY_DN69_c0_g1_i3.p1 TRINITY_DN69_c0_g1~~TRINITY_DN69_c0_g1_i3.p1  ORF type:complete len:269 (+),score=5.58 TRINITY_DN69_c0_g1_i3:36-842(+)
MLNSTLPFQSFDTSVPGPTAFSSSSFTSSFPATPQSVLPPTTYGFSGLPQTSYAGPLSTSFPTSFPPSFSSSSAWNTGGCSACPPQPVCPPVQVTSPVCPPPAQCPCPAPASAYSALTFPPVFAQTLHPQPMAAPPSFNFSQVSTQLSTTVVQREVPGAAAFAAEFHDLRDMLDRDRTNFESSRSQFERAMAERELKVKLDEEKLTSEWSRLRAEQEALEKKNSADTIVVKTLQEGQAMDVKDGVIDGKFNGKQIVVEGVGPSFHHHT